MGKTTVVEMFLRRLAAGGERWTARGQCVEHAGEREPSLPFVEALGRLGHEPAVLAVLRRYAPLWLAQLPRLVSEDAHLVEVRPSHTRRRWDTLGEARPPAGGAGEAGAHAPEASDR